MKTSLLADMAKKVWLSMLIVSRSNDKFMAAVYFVLRSQLSPLHTGETEAIRHKLHTKTIFSSNPCNKITVVCYRIFYTYTTYSEENKH